MITAKSVTTSQIQHTVIFYIFFGKNHFTYPEAFKMFLNCVFEAHNLSKYKVNLC